MSKWLFRCMLVGSSLTVQGLQWNYLHGSSLGSAPWPLGMPGLWWIKPLKQKRVWSTMIHLARGFVLFSGESISDVDHNMIQIYLDTCWSYPKLWNQFIHRSSTLRSPASVTILWQVVGNSATSWVWIPADVAHCCSKDGKKMLKNDEK